MQYPSGYLDGDDNWQINTPKEVAEYYTETVFGLLRRVCIRLKKIKRARKRALKRAKKRAEKRAKKSAEKRAQNH